MEGEATPTRSVPLPVKEKEEETEEAREKEKGGIVVVAKGVYMVAMLTTSPKIFIQILKWNQLPLIHFIDVIATDKFSYNCK